MKIVIRKITFLILALLNGFAFSQEEGKFRVSLDLGYAIPSTEGIGIAIYLEPMYNIKDNISVGIRLGTISISNEIEFSNGNSNDTRSDTNGIFLATFDYHFNKIKSNFVPFAGVGLGYASIAKIGFDRFSEVDNKKQYNGKFGGMIRGGFEWKKFRLGLDYNFIPQSDLIDFNGDKIGHSKNSYFGINLGFFVGGGKW